MSVSYCPCVVDSQVMCRTTIKRSGLRVRCVRVSADCRMALPISRPRTVQRGLIEGNCPNCGAGVAINQNVNCPHCKAMLKNGEYDWVLTEITQATEFQRHQQRDVPGLAALQARDHNAIAADLEDRASVMFWRLNLADRDGSIDPIRKIAEPAYAEKYAVRFAPNEHGIRHCYMDCGVGSVTLSAVRVGKSAADNDHALIEVRWSENRSGWNRPASSRRGTC
jgi:hypothetical protein